MTETSKCSIFSCRLHSAASIGGGDIATYSEAKLAYIEEIGLALEAQGLPRMAGRVLGALLVADPPEQSAEELAATLRASRGSISTMTRLLEGPGIIERIARPGERKVYYRNRPDAWYNATQNRLGAMSGMRTLAARGLELLTGASPDVRLGLADMHEFYAFWEHEIPVILRDWQAQREAKRISRDDGT